MPHQRHTTSGRLIYFVAGAPQGYGLAGYSHFGFSSQILSELATNVRVANLQFLCSGVRLISKSDTERTRAKQRRRPSHELTGREDNLIDEKFDASQTKLRKRR